MVLFHQQQLSSVLLLLLRSLCVRGGVGELNTQYLLESIRVTLQNILNPSSSSSSSSQISLCVSVCGSLLSCVLLLLQHMTDAQYNSVSPLLSSMFPLFSSLLTSQQPTITHPTHLHRYSRSIHQNSNAGHKENSKNFLPQIILGIFHRLFRRTEV